MLVESVLFWTRSSDMHCEWNQKDNVSVNHCLPGCKSELDFGS